MESRKPSARNEQGHPLLRGGRAPYPHPFSEAQMESLRAICDTLIPSLHPPKHVTRDEDVAEFYRLSGASDGIPEHVAGLVVTHIVKHGAFLAWLVLWLLSTRFGTLLLCGRRSLSNSFPYIHKFAAIPRVEREQILISWNQATRLGILFRLTFLLFKSCCLFSFYATADKNGSNPAWKAIEYTVPAEEFGHYCESAPSASRPLANGVIDLSAGTGSLTQFLTMSDFTVTEDSKECQMLCKKMPKARKYMKVECDAVVVGSGAGGGVAAGVLAKAGYNVLVLDKGKYYAGEDLSLLEGPSLDQMYESGCMLTTLDAGVFIAAGATVGGGTAINWSACLRTPPHVIKEWSTDHGLSIFGTEEYQRAMDTVCARLHVVNQCDKEGFQNAVLRKGCQRLGYTIENVPRNASTDHFCGLCNLGCKTGNKKGTHQTWLVDAVAAGARVLAGCCALQVVHAPLGKRQKTNKKRGAQGVLASLGPDCLYVQAKAVVVAAGALGTPPLLRASGLRNPNIGKNLHLHPVIFAWGYFPQGRGEVNDLDGKCYEGGIITSMCKQGDAEGKTIIQTPALNPGMMSSLMPWTSGADMKERMLRYSRTANLFALVRDRGCGRVWGKGFISYTLNHKYDAYPLAQGLERALRILMAAGATEVGTYHSDGERFSVGGASQEQVEDFLVRVKRKCLKRSVWNKLGSAHQMGSCRMGMDPATSCVDGSGESWEVESLFVSDASVLPTALGVNPMITVESVALCISRRVSQFLRNQR